MWDFDIRRDDLISTKRPDLEIVKKKERIFKTVDFAVPAEHRIKLKECEKKDKYFNIARESENCYMKVIIIPIEIGAFSTVTKGSLKGPVDLMVGGRLKTRQTTELLRTTRILRRVVQTWGD